MQVTLPDDIVRSKVFYLEPTSLEDAIEQIDQVRNRFSSGHLHAMDNV